MRSLILSLYSTVRLPGVVLHELSHLLVVILTPGINVESVNLTSEIEHSGYYTGFRMFLISYAPLFANSVLAYVLVVYSPFITVSEPTSVMVSVFSTLLAFSLLLGMIPSYIDAVNPVKMAYMNLKSNPVSIVPLYMPFILLASLPFVTITYVLKKLPSFAVIFEVIMAVFILLLFTGHVEVNSLIELTNRLGVF